MQRKFWDPAGIGT